MDFPAEEDGILFLGILEHLMCRVSRILKVQL